MDIGGKGAGTSAAAPLLGGDGDGYALLSGGSGGGGGGYSGGAGAGASLALRGVTTTARIGAAAATAGSGGFGAPASRRALPSDEPSVIDAGFEGHTEFDRGVVTVWPGTDSLDLSALQSPLPAGAHACGVVTVGLCAVSLVGIPYLLAKLTLVRRGEVGLVEHVNGTMRLLEPGACHRSPRRRAMLRHRALICTRCASQAGTSWRRSTRR